MESMVAKLLSAWQMSLDFGPVSYADLWPIDKKCFLSPFLRTWFYRLFFKLCADLCSFETELIEDLYHGKAGLDDLRLRLEAAEYLGERV